MNHPGRARPGVSSWLSLLTVCVAVSFLIGDTHAGWPGGAQDDGQVRASTLLLSQVGRETEIEPATPTESFRTSPDDGFIAASYDEITQKYVDWRGDGLHLRVGNGYATFGRGLLFSAFELTGVIQDAAFPNAKYVDSRDLEGFVIDVDRGPLRATVVAGEPVRNPDYPHGREDDFLLRREGTVSGAHAALRFHRGFEMGGSYLRTQQVNFLGLEELGGVDATLRLHALIPELRERDAEISVYAEYGGRSWRPFDDGFETADGTPHALYTATEISVGRWGLSYETKDYEDFLLGINDPPNLVPEMSQHLLNRMSHFLLQENETGHQFSVMGALPGDWTLQLESARAENDLGNALEYALDFLGLESPAHAATRGEIFAATGRDEVATIFDHWTVGGSLDRDLDDALALLVSFEYQKVTRRVFDTDSEFENMYVGLAVSRSGTGTAGVMAEFSNDPDEKDDPQTIDVVETEPRRWLGAFASVLIGHDHEVSLFAGHRRGGTACISGTCYLVPDFSGVEMRVSSRF